MKVLAILDLVSEDDGMIWVKTGCVNGNGKEEIAIINETKCAGVDDKMLKTMFDNWSLFANSPEYPLIRLLHKALTEEEPR